MLLREASEAAPDPSYDDIVDKTPLNKLKTAVSAGRIQDLATNRAVISASEKSTRDSGAKVLTLEEELLVLKKSSIEKDRMIRALEQENMGSCCSDIDLRTSKQTFPTLRRQTFNLVKAEGY